MRRVRRKSRRKSTVRRHPRWRVILGFLLLLNVGLGIANSQVTRVRQVRVEGAMTHDHERLKGILAALQNKPVLKVDVRRTEWEALLAPEVREATMSLNPFGSAHLKVRYRTPIVQLDARPDVVMDADGVLFTLPISAIPPNLPVLKLERKLPPTLASVVADWPSSRIAKLATEVRTLSPEGGVRIDVDDRGAVCLNIGNGRVVLGSTDDLDRKLTVLRQRMADDPGELGRVVELNLMEPDRPSVVPRVQPPPARTSP